VLAWPFHLVRFSAQSQENWRKDPNWPPFVALCGETARPSVNRQPARDKLMGTSRSISRILSGRCRPGRSSICDRCCQRSGAIYPKARASSPQAPPQTRTRPLDLAPGGVYRAIPVTWAAGGLLHRRFTLTSVSMRWLGISSVVGGGLLSVALSRGSPRVGVTHHLALWSPDFPQRRLRAAAIA
jgi:hypothetical protein